MQLNELPWPSVEGLPSDLPVVIPIAAVEQHGEHLPVATDSMLLAEIVRRVEESLGDQFLAAPVQWLGNSHHHLDFPGTLSAPPRAYLDMVQGLVQNFLDHGFRRVLLLNGHGGNDVPGKQVLFELRQQQRRRKDLLLLFATYWGLVDDLSQVDGLHQTQMGHACEWETSMMLQIAPELVGDYQAAEIVEPGNPFRPASRAWITKDRSRVGHLGWPNLASAEKGEALLEAFSSGVVNMIHRMRVWDGQSWDG